MYTVQKKHAVMPSKTEEPLSSGYPETGWSFHSSVDSREEAVRQADLLNDVGYFARIREE